MAAFTPGNLVIYRVGTGSGALSNAATAVFLDEYTPAGTLVQSIALPTTGIGLLTASGTATSEGLLNRSTDGHFLLVTGYNAAVGTSGVASGSDLRIIDSIGANGTVITVTTTTAFSGNNIRSATSIDGTAIWASGGNGIQHAIGGATASNTVASQNSRDIAIFDGQLYVSSSSGSIRLATVGTGTPTTSGQTVTNLPGLPTANPSSPYQFFLADLSAGVAGVDTLYYADDGVDQILKYTFNGTTWSADGGVAATDFRGLTATVTGSTVTLYVTSAGSLSTITDASGYDGTLSGSLASLATAGANTAFRGVAFAPTAAAGPDTTPPSFTSPASFNAPENQTAAGTVVATDATTPITYSLNGGEDMGLFAIDLNSGVLTFISSPDFEGASADGDDIYEVTVRASDAVTPANSVNQQIQVTVTDVIEGGPPQPLVINEIDADQTGTDGAEFIELHGTAGASLDGYVLVLYNGSNDQSYAAFDLDGFSLDAGGYFVLGNSAVANVNMILAGNTLQNGADAVALYLGNAADFPNGTAVTAASLVDAVVYENNHPDDRGLIDVLTPGQAQVNENERGAGASQSLQRATDGAGGPLNTTAFTQAAPTPGAANVLPATAAASATVTHFIHDVQGNPTTQTDDGFGDPAGSPLRGQTVTLEGYVVGDFQSGDGEARRSLNGFYLQEENADFDLDALTSEGIFVFGGTTDVNEGDLVRVTGVVQESFGLTRLQVTGITIVDDAAVADVSSLAVDVHLPAASATLNQNGKYQPHLEAFEGMLVRIPETLTITEQFQLDRFNEIKLSVGGQLETFTNEFEPSTPGYAAHLQQIGARTITYDDGQNTQNESVNNFDGFDPDDDGAGPSAALPGEPGYNTATAYRMGDTVTGLTGVLDYQFAGDAAASGSTWRVRSIDDGDNTFAHTNPRPDAPPIVGGSLKVASFNVLNYFTTLDAAGATTASGLAPRGANTAFEFQRQTDKLVNFIATLDADVIGLTELENDFFDANPGDGDPEGNAIAHLVGQLNASLGAGTYAWVNPGSQLDGQVFGGDAISVGFIYKPSKVEVAFGTTIQKLDDSDAEAAALLGQSSIGHIFNGVNTSRAALAVTFEELATDEQFTAVINHFKSKSGNGAAGSADEDKLDGQGAWQNQRELAAKALTDWIDGNPTGTTDTDILLMGDFNAYLKEDAVDLIEAGGFHNLAEERIADPNSFVFDAQTGALDHAFASNSLNGQVTGIEEWHINSDEADALDYNADFDKDPLYFNGLSPARESDHDPVVIGLELDSTPATTVIDGVTVYTAAPSLTGTVGAAPTATNALQLVRLGAYATTNDAGTAASPNAEVVAYDKTTATLYVQNTNEGRIEIVSLSSSGALTKTGEINLTGLAGYGGVNSVAVHDGLVAVAYANATGGQPGRVALFDSSGALVNSLVVGVGPDQVVFTADGTKILVANEAEMAGTAGSPIQTAGGISIIDVSGGAASASVRNTIAFDVLNGSEAQLRANGLAITPGNSAANDIEPEYITISPDGTKAYVTLQEVNGVAIIDLANATATKPIAIVPLGAVNHALAGNEFDASDRDGPGNTASIHIATTPAGTPIFGLLQPDSIASFTANGATYFVTANEGDQRVIGGVDDTADVARLSTISNSLLTPELQALKADPNYARLNVLLRYGDTDNDGVIDQLHTMGGRSISIFKQEADGSVTKVRETGGEFEKIFASIAPDRFNNDQVTGNTPDDRSDNKGPEPEGITVGEVDGHIYAFIGLERQSGVMVYDITTPESASFVSYVPPLAASTADLGPEVLKFISAADSPTGTALVITANEVANGGATVYAALPAGYTQQVQLASGSLSVSHDEGNAGTTDFTFTVERTGGTLGAVDFTVQLASSAATAGDFSGVAALPQTINGTIAAGATSATVTVQVAGDTEAETAENFTLTLQSATASQAGVAAAVNAAQGTATGTIQNDDVAAPAGYTLQILHFSDGEAGLAAVDDAPRLAAVVDRLEDLQANSITLASGDNYIPSPFFNASGDPALDPFFEESIGRGDIRILNTIGVEASVIGNHEFDAGPREVQNLIRPVGAGADGGGTYEGTRFPYLAANLNFAGEPDLAPNATTSPITEASFGTGASGGQRLGKSAILEENGQRIGVVGVTTPVFEDITTAGGVRVIGPRGLDANDGDDSDFVALAAIVQAQIDALTAQGINKIVIVSQLQEIENETKLISFLRDVDVVIAGGSNTLLSDNTDVLRSGDVSEGQYGQIFTNAGGGQTILVNTDGNYKYVGRLVVEFDDNGNILPGSLDPNVNGAYATDDAGVARVYQGSGLDPFADGTRGDTVRDLTTVIDGIISEKDKTQFGRTDVYIEGRRGEVRSQETNLGNLSADANLFYAKHTDSSTIISIKNGGGIRDSIGSFGAAGEELPPVANPEAGKQAGEISQLDIENSLRFNNALSLVTLTPQQLLEALENGVSNPGGIFAQVGGLRFSYDPTRPVGDRVRMVAIVDDDGQITSVVVRDGDVVADAPAAIRMVTLSFLIGGTTTVTPQTPLGFARPDGFRFAEYIAANPAFANRVDLDPDSSGADDVAARNGLATFTDNGREQDALAEYLAATHTFTPFNQADTPPALDARIQNVKLRDDDVLDAAPVIGSPNSDFMPGTPANDTIKAGGGPDFVAGGLGDDDLDGESGDDTAVFNVDFNTVQVLFEDGKLVIVSAEGRDTVKNFEHIQFADGNIDLNDGNALVDDLFYFARNKDVWDAGMDPETHFNTFGWLEGRDPNPEFSTAGYLAANPDVKAAGINPLTHYNQIGWKEGRDPSPTFDTKLYLLDNPDVAAAGVNPLTHYEQSGRAEGREIFSAIGDKITNGFDATFYLLGNPDVAAAGIDPLQHFNAIGWTEGRNPNAFFDTTGYLQNYADVAAASINPLAHYMASGAGEGRDPSVGFDTTSYLAANPDVAAAHLNPLQHFLQFGTYEGRSPHADGIWG